jgi:hypothetical protein
MTISRTAKYVFVALGLVITGIGMYYEARMLAYVGSVITFCGLFAPEK